MKISNALDIAGIPPRTERLNEQQTLSVATQSDPSSDIPMAIADKVDYK